MGQEVIAHKEAEKHKVVNQSFKIEPKGRLESAEFKVEVLSQSLERNVLKTRKIGHF